MIFWPETLSLSTSTKRNPPAKMEVHVLDNYYLAITLLITIGYQLFFFAIAFSLKFDKLTGMFTPTFAGTF